MQTRTALFALLLISHLVTSQDWSTQLPSGLPPNYSGSVEWADYDKDGDYDLLMTGDSTDQYGIFTAIYTNKGANKFEAVPNTGLLGVRNSDATWGDYDNDGDLDIALSGWGSNFQNFTKLYENDGNMHFTENTKFDFAACFNSNLAWGDYNNDGLLDLLSTGDLSMMDVAKVYTNKGNGQFEELNAPLAGISQAAISWVDMNNDGYLDIYTSGLTGDMALKPATKLYLNNKQGNFTELSNHGIAPTFNGSVDWGDYDNDGDLDVIITGGQPFCTKLYKNNKATFSEVLSSFDQVGEFSSAHFGDYDQDGKLDLVVKGRGEPTTDIIFLDALYRNKGNDQFERVNGFLFSMPTTRSCDWIDLDHDKDLDLYFFFPNSSPSLSIWVNGPTIVNQAPSTPSGLSAARVGDRIYFSWRKASDNTTPPNSLTYNLRIGTTPKGQEVLNSYADPSTGLPYLNQRGNMGPDTTFVLYSAPKGPLYCSIQAIDHSRTPSAFSPEKVVDQVTGLVNDLREIKEGDLYTSGSKEHFEVHDASSVRGAMEIQILSVQGETLFTKGVVKEAEASTFSFNLSSLPSGLYLLHLSDSSQQRTKRFFLW